MKRRQGHFADMMDCLKLHWPRGGTYCIVDQMLAALLPAINAESVAWVGCNQQH
jgi:hypothetical protein